MSVFCTLGLLLFTSLQGCVSEARAIPGYVEGEYVSIAPLSQGLIRKVHVAKGDAVQAGQLLVELDSDDTALQLAQAQSRLLEARAALANLGTGRRPQEIEVLSAAMASLEAEERRAQLEARRAAALFEKNVNSRAQIDATESSLEIARSRLAEGRANLIVARLPARADEVLAQEQRVAQAEAALKLALWAHAQRTLTALSDARVDEVIRHAGELTGPVAPVLSLLPKDAVRVRFYIDQPERALIRIGSTVTLTCDSCPQGLRARVVRLANKPEFTPPVIYSIERRQKLSYLVEALGENHEDVLQPGQMLSVSIIPQ